MLGLVAAQLKLQAAQGAWSQTKPIWVDVRLKSSQAHQGMSVIG